MSTKPKYEEHLGLAKHYASQFKGYLKQYPSITMDDLIAEANMALWQACERYDPSKKVDFLYFAAISMKYAVRNFLLAKGATISQPYHAIKAQADIEKLLESGVAFDDLSDHGITQGDLSYFKHKTTAEIMPETYDAVEDTDEVDDRLEVLSKAIQFLNDDERDLLSKVYGLDGQDRIKQVDLAKEMGIEPNTLNGRTKALRKKLRKLMDKGDATTK